MTKKKNYIFNLILLKVLLVLFLVYPRGINDELIWLCLSIFYFYFFKSIIKPIAIISNIKTFMKIDVFFMMFYYVIFYHPYQMHVLGMSDIDQSEFLNKTFSEYTNPAVILATIGLVSFQLGFHKTFFKEKIKRKAIYSRLFFKKLNYAVLILTIFILLLYSQTGMVAMFASTYAGSTTGDVTYDAIFHLVTYFIILSSISALFYYYTYKKLNLIPIVLISIALIWCIALLIIGDRNTFFIIAIVLVSGYYTFVKGITRKRIILLIIPALFLYQVVEISRTNDERNLEAIWLAMTETNVEEEGIDIGSFGITTITLRATFHILEGEQDYFYGKFKIVSLASIIPYSSRLFVTKNDIYTGSSSVLTEEIIGKKATWSSGTNIISDAYFDFGVFGVIVILYLFGYFGGFVKSKLLNEPNNAKWVFIYLILIGYYSELSRYSFDFPLRSIAWTFLLFSLLGIKKKYYYEKNI